MAINQKLTHNADAPSFKVTQDTEQYIAVATTAVYDYVDFPAANAADFLGVTEESNLADKESRINIDKFFLGYVADVYATGTLLKLTATGTFEEAVASPDVAVAKVQFASTIADELVELERINPIALP